MMDDRVTFGLKRSNANGLIWLFGWISGAIFYFGVESDKRIKQKAMQSIIVSGIIMILKHFRNLAFNLPYLGWPLGRLFSRAANIMIIIVFIFAILDFFKKDMHMPIISNISRRIVN